MLQHRRYQKDLTRCSLSGCLMLIPKLVTGSVLPISSDGFPDSFPILKKYFPSWYTHITSFCYKYLSFVTSSPITCQGSFPLHACQRCEI